MFTNEDSTIPWAVREADIPLGGQGHLNHLHTSMLRYRSLGLGCILLVCYEVASMEFTSTSRFEISLMLLFLSIC